MATWGGSTAGNLESIDEDDDDDDDDDDADDDQDTAAGQNGTQMMLALLCEFIFLSLGLQLLAPNTILLHVTRSCVGLHRISASANSKFGHFSRIRPNSASAKFLAEFGRRQCNCSAFS